MEINSIISQNTIRLRKNLQWTQEDLAHYADLTTSTVSKIERGLANPTVATLDLLAHALGVELADLVRPK